MNKIFELWYSIRGRDNEFYLKDSEGEEVPQRRACQTCPTAKGKSRLREYSVKSHSGVWPDWCIQS